MEHSTLVKRHGEACDLAGIEPLPFYTCRHICLTRWLSHTDPSYTLAYFAGHRDFGTTGATFTQTWTPGARFHGKA